MKTSPSDSVGTFFGIETSTPEITPSNERDREERNGGFFPGNLDISAGTHPGDRRSGTSPEHRAEGLD